MSKRINISVVCVIQNQPIMRNFQMPSGSTVADAIKEARASGAFPPDENTFSGCAIFGRRVEPVTALHDGDRVEWLQPLRCDPKESRRLRAHARAKAAE
ncbi:MAG: RnfH family protein [Burkholderiales bacterium]|nr:RnfH family protein [Burkholderiales bacterium]